MRQIYYLGYYTCEQIKKDNRASFPAANTKMDYIVDAALRSGAEKINIISASGTKNSKYVNGDNINISKEVNLKTFFSFGEKNSITTIVKIALLQIQLLFYLLLKMKKNDKLIVYHSLGYIFPVIISKKIKKFSLIEEVEEIYSDVSGNGFTMRLEKIFFENADSYIFSTNLLNEKINKHGKKFVISNGTYKAIETADIKDKNTTCPEIKCVYAGTFDSKKGGAVAAIESAKYLPQNYTLHVLGFGNESDTKKIKDMIQEAQESAASQIIYDGTIVGKQYTEFLQMCDIGLSTQNSNLAFNASSFPSKILSYMSNGLRVVSARIPVVETSDVGKYIYYYDNQSPEEIAKVIMSIDINDNYDSRMILKQLDYKFCKEISGLIWEID